MGTISNCLHCGTRCGNEVKSTLVAIVVVMVIVVVVVVV